MIKIENVSYTYETYAVETGLFGALKDFRKRNKTVQHALKNINLTVQSGEIIGLLGPNGAGKTTLIKLLCGILTPTRGTVTCDGFTPYKKEKAYLKEIGAVIGQKSQLLWDLPPLETLNMLKVIYDIEAETFQKNLEYMVGLMSLEQKLNIPVRKLSLGERIKFEIICSLIHSPKILFLDEPTIGLDLTSQRNIHQFLREINQTMETTIILTSHYMKDIETLAERIVIVMDGEKVEDTTIQQLKKQFSLSEKYRLTFKSNIPKELEGYRQVESQTIEFEKAEFAEVLQRLTPKKLEEIESLVEDAPKFEEIIYQIFNRKQAE
ncbi:MAG: ATP-binding cassette domain-containing protein [Enterococcus sp.]